MLAGKPVIASDQGGPLEIIKNNETGILIQPREPEVLAEAILGLYNDPKMRKKLGKNARNYAIKNFNVKEQIKKIERIHLGIV